MFTVSIISILRTENVLELHIREASSFQGERGGL